MFCDDDFNVCVAGKVIEEADAVKLPWKWIINNKTATAAQIRAEWKAILGVSKGFPGYYNTDDYVQLYLTQKDIDRHFVVN